MAPSAANSTTGPGRAACPSTSQWADPIARELVRREGSEDGDVKHLPVLIHLSCVDTGNEETLGVRETAGVDVDVRLEALQDTDQERGCNE